MEFLLGLGKFFHAGDKQHRALARGIVESKLGFHFCLDYPGAAKFVRKTTSRSERNELAFMARVPCFDSELLVRETDETLKSLDIECITTLQLWGGDEVFDCWNEETDLHVALSRLKREGKIHSFVPQLYFDQTSKIRDSHKNLPFAFYGSPLGFHIDPEILFRLSGGGSIAMAVFGSLDRTSNPKFVSIEERKTWLDLRARLGWNSFCLATLSCFTFVGTAVGSTTRLGRLAEIVAHLRSPPALSQIEQQTIRNVAIRNFQNDHLAVKDARQRWSRNSAKMRSTGMAAKSLAYYQVGRWPAAKTLVDFFRGH